MLIPGKSVIASVLSYPGFQGVGHFSDFGKWVQAGIHQYYRLIRAGKILSEQEVIKKIGNYPIVSFQYVQIKDFLIRQQERFSFFRPLMAFELLGGGRCSIPGRV